MFKINEVDKSRLQLNGSVLKRFKTCKKKEINDNFKLLRNSHEDPVQENVIL